MSITIFSVTLLSFEILRVTTCLMVKPDSTTKDNFDQNLNQNWQQYYYRSGPNITNVATIEEDDPNYPYEQLLQLVEDTKQILRSGNVTEKTQLNLDPLIYDDYLNGDLSDSNLDFNVDTQIYPFGLPGASDSCPIFVQYRLPKRLRATNGKEYFIVNIGKQLRQKYNTIVCKYLSRSCGDSSQSEGYTHACYQSFNRIRSFVSIPVNDISLAKQQLRSFALPDNCICKISRNKL